MTFFALANAMAVGISRTILNYKKLALLQKPFLEFRLEFRNVLLQLCHAIIVDENS